MDKKGHIFGYTNTVASSKESHITTGLTLNVQGVKTALTSGKAVPKIRAS